MYGIEKAISIVVLQRIILMNDSWVQLPSFKVTVWYYAPRSFRAQYLTLLKDSLYFILNENLQMSYSIVMNESVDDSNRYISDSKDHLPKEPTQITVLLQIYATLEVSNPFAIH